MARFRIIFSPSNTPSEQYHLQEKMGFFSGWADVTELARFHGSRYYWKLKQFPTVDAAKKFAQDRVNARKEQECKKPVIVKEFNA